MTKALSRAVQRAGKRGFRLRDDAREVGSVSFWPLALPAVLIMVLMIVVVGVKGGWLASVKLIGIWVLLLVVAAVLGSIPSLLDVITRARRGRQLRQWLGLTSEEELGRWQLREWRRCRRRGFGARDAQTWADQGLPYGLMAATRRGREIPLRAVRQLADILADTGHWDGSDRVKLDDLCGWMIEINAGATLPILHRWFAFTPEQVRAVAESERGQTWPDVLTRLEDTFGVAGWKRAARPNALTSWG